MKENSCSLEKNSNHVGEEGRNGNDLVCRFAVVMLVFQSFAFWVFLFVFSVMFSLLSVLFASKHTDSAFYPEQTKTICTIKHNLI